MDEKDSRYHNMGPRLDLDLRPGQSRQGQSDQSPYRRQAAPPYHQQNPPTEPAAGPGNFIAQPDVQPRQYGQPAHNETWGGYAAGPDNYGPHHNDHWQKPDAGPNKTAATAGKTRWLLWLALLFSIMALGASLFMGRIFSPIAALPEFNGEPLSVAAAERVVKLEKDVSSLLLKMVTLEKEVESIKNRAWSPAAISDLTNKLSALQNQVKDLETKLAAASRHVSAAAPERPNQGAEPASTRPVTQPAGTESPASAPEANYEVQSRAGDKPGPLAANMADASRTSAPAGQPRASYTVQKNDTLFGIAQRYQVTTRDLMQWNSMGPDDVLKVGKILVIY